MSSISEQKPIDQEGFQLLLRNSTLRELRAVPYLDGYALEATFDSGPVRIRSQREDVRKFATLDAIKSFCERVGVKRFLVDL